MTMNRNQYPCVEFDLDKLAANLAALVERCHDSLIEVAGVVKAVSSLPEIVRVYEESGVKFIATSRISQMRAIREAGICKKPLMLIRIPMLSELPDVVELCDISLQSDIIVLRALNEEAKKHPDVVFGMMFNQRTNCIHRKMRELVQSGVYGNIRRTNWIITNWYRPQAYYDSGDWRATWSGEGGGVLLNQCPHQLDLWQWICGMPKKVEAHLHYGMWHNIEVEDDVTTYVEYENGATGVFITSTGDAHGTNRFEIQLDKAKIVAEGDRLTVLEYDMTEQEFSKTNTNPFGMVGAHEVDPQLDGENPQHKGVINAWGGAILRGEPLIAGGEEGINGLTLSNAMHLSSWLGREITLPFDEDLYYNELMKRVATSKRKTDVKEVVADTSNTYAGSK